MRNPLNTELNHDPEAPRFENSKIVLILRHLIHASAYMKTRHASLVLILLLCATSLLAQYHGKPYVINYNPDQYRLDNQNWSLDINEQGVIYIGNNKGLIEFDGSNWNYYGMPEEMVVRSVETVGDSLIYVGAYEEFGYWKRDHKGRMTYHSLSDTITQPYFHNDEIWRIIEHKEKIYFQSFSTYWVKR